MEIFGQIQGLVGKEGATIIETAIKNAHQPEISSFASLISRHLPKSGATPRRRQTQGNAHQDDFFRTFIIYSYPSLTELPGAPLGGAGSRRFTL